MDKIEVIGKRMPGLLGRKKILRKGKGTPWVLQWFKLSCWALFHNPNFPKGIIKFLCVL